MSQSDVDVWLDDLLGRKREADFIKRFLIKRSEEYASTKRGKSYVLNIDGAWGQGKSFFLEHLHKDLIESGHLSVYVNAWKDDHAEDPMIAVMAAIDLAVKNLLKKQPFIRKAWETARKQGLRIAITTTTYGAKKLASTVLGDGVEAIAEIIADNVPTDAKKSEDIGKDAANKIVQEIDKIVDKRSERALKHFEDTKISIDRFKENLGYFINKLSSEGLTSPPMFILIDELDRCRPPYAIATLERAKHFFDVASVVFIVATDSNQLRHSIRAVYGEGFDSKKYLLRFFDRTYRLMQPTNDMIIHKLFDTSPLRTNSFEVNIVSAEKMFLIYANSFNLTLRDIEQCYDHLRTICTTWAYARPVPLVYIIPLIMFFQQGETDDFDVLRNGDIPSGLKQRLGNSSPLETWQFRASIDQIGIGTTNLIDLLRYFLDLSNNGFQYIMEKSAKRQWQTEMKQPFIRELREGNNDSYPDAGQRSEILNTYIAVISSGQFDFDINSG